MEKEFVPYDEALQLKELGFDEPCFGYYSFGNELIIETTSHQMISEGCCTSPTFSQAFRLFREKYGLEGVAQRADDYIWYKWRINQYNRNGKEYVVDMTEFETYEQAELACLKKLIEIVKENENKQ